MSLESSLHCAVAVCFARLDNGDTLPAGASRALRMLAIRANHWLANERDIEPLWPDEIDITMPAGRLFNIAAVGSFQFANDNIFPLFKVEPLRDHTAGHDASAMEQIARMWRAIEQCVHLDHFDLTTAPVADVHALRSLPEASAWIDLFLATVIDRQEEIRTRIGREACFVLPRNVERAWVASYRGDTRSVPELFLDKSGRTFAAPVTDGTARQPAWVFAPQQGVNLLLPFPDDAIVPAHGFGPLIRSRYTGAMQRAYMAMWALWAANNRPADGSFRLDRSAAMSMLGVERVGRSYGRNWIDFVKDLKAMTKVHLSSAGDWRAATPEPLINLHERAGKLYVVHAPIAVRAVLQDPDFTQMPSAVLRLPAPDMIAAVGFANLWRDVITTDVLAPGAAGHHREQLSTLLDRIGAHNPNDARKLGRAYYPAALAKLQRIATEGELGRLTVHGEGREAWITLEPSDALATAYRGLAEAAGRRRAMGAEAATRIIVRAAEAAKRPKKKKGQRGSSK